ncbi:MAG: hypothetical protein H7338_17360 [Candidatus Sericytochromatia bacterium]|nr:hypothetical protein [Candidatus Sericytochromatia bacterium]
MPKPPALVIGPDLPALAARWRRDATAWAVGRSWPPRALLLMYVASAGYRRLGDREASCWFDGLTLLIHELGHLLFQPFGEFLMVAGGSITQLAAPLLTMFLFRRQGDWFGVSVAGGWLAMSAFHLAVYVADAQDMSLPLVGFGSDPEHDWHYLLAATGTLHRSATYARLLEGGATLVWLASCLSGAWLIWLIARAPAASDGPARGESATP